MSINFKLEMVRTLLAGYSLQLPAQIQIGGAFQLGDENDRIQSPTLYNMSSSWAGESSLVYNPNAIAAASSVANRLASVNRLGFKRLQAGLIFFGHASNGWSKSFQLSHIGLFAALEALFVPSRKKAKDLSKRVADFLSRFDFTFAVQEWLHNEYVNGRSKLVHGIHAASFESSLSPARQQAFGRLHEITRLSLLGFLSLCDNELKELSMGSGATLQQAIGGIGVAGGEFLENQRVWAT